MENIEAMLCAFIEGELDQAGRAEIEKHLRENPQHRKLIAEVLATRDLIRGLPRVNAPRDIDESMGGQVVRSILLETAQAKASAAARSPRWPRILAVAAVFLLCASLGLLVLHVVGPTFKPRNIQQVDSNTLDSGSTLESRAPDPVAMEMGQNGAAIGGAAPRALAAADAQRDMESMRQNLERSGYAGALARTSDSPTPAIVLVVHSANPSMTNERLADFFRNHDGIVWSQVPTAVGMSGTGQPSEAPMIADAPNIARGATTQPDSQVAGSLTAQASRPRSAPLTKESSITNSNNSFQGNEPEFAPEASRGPNSTNEAVSVKSLPTTRRIGGVYVVKGLTSEQAEELQQSLTPRQEVQNLEVLLPPVGANAASPQPTNSPSPGLERMNFARQSQAEPTDNLSNSNDKERQTEGASGGAGSAARSSPEMSTRPDSARVDAVIVIQLSGSVGDNQTPVNLPRVLIGRIESTQSDSAGPPNGDVQQNLRPPP